MQDNSGILAEYNYNHLATGSLQLHLSDVNDWEDTVAAVSYTHLDVYKRQRVNSAKDC